MPCYRESMHYNSRALPKQATMRNTHHPPMPFHKLAAVLLLVGAELSARLHVVGALPQPTSNCTRICGGIEIPYPFGLLQDSPDCALPGFSLSCNKTADGVYKPFLPNMDEVLNISMEHGVLRVMNSISSNCFNSTSGDMESSTRVLNMTGTPYRISNAGNMFTVVGCQTMACIRDEDVDGKYASGCVSMCRQGERSLVNGSCSGLGCCQTAIPPGLQYYKVRFDKGFNNTGSCSYAVLMDSSNFTFKTSYATTPEFNTMHGGRAPLVLDWAIGNQTCEAARTAPESPYACVSANSNCFNTLNGAGYICNCSKGYQGNPYLTGPHGCNDINECVHNPCAGICVNRPGSFQCVCPKGTRGNGTSGPCQKEPPKGEQLAMVIAGSGLGCIIVFLGMEWIRLKRRNRRQDLMRSRDAYFRHYGGLILKDILKRESNSSLELYDREEIESATKHFNALAIIGEGGQGTVYEGYIGQKNNHVAIKRCKGFDESRREEFGTELLILSRVKHDNIVNLLGCCLQIEVPVLVYEFVPNGTLHHLIHVQREPSIRTLGIRLKIATESAEALRCLHSQEKPIFHGDVKSANILLGDNFVAKVSDFGCSAIWTADENPYMAKGTMGYLDPEYLLKFELTDKSDVYSFGVVLLELLTRRKPLSKGKQSLASVFQEAMKNGNLDELVDFEIVHQDTMELVHQVAKLAYQCLVLTGESRPKMSQVAQELRRLTSQAQPSHPHLGSVGHLMVYDRSAVETSEYDTEEERTTDYYSFKKKASMSIEVAR